MVAVMEEIMRKTLDKSFFITRRITHLVALLIFGVPFCFSGCTHIGEATEFREAEIPEQTEETSSDEGERADTSSDTCIYVHVCGEVYTPGVYELAAGSRVFEAVEAAGGMKDTASPSSLNQAEVLKDGQQIYVPSCEEAGSMQNEMQEADDGKVNLNTAAKDELMTLAGIGEVKAEAIIRYREEKGGFTSIEELKEIEGIKEGVFAKIKDQIKVS